MHTAFYRQGGPCLPLLSFLFVVVLQVQPSSIHLSNRHPLSPRHQRTLFIQLIYSRFLRNLVSTNSIAPCSVDKPYTTHSSSIRSDEGLTLETSKLIIKKNSVRWSIYIINSVNKANLRVSLPRRSSTTVSSETDRLKQKNSLLPAILE